MSKYGFQGQRPASVGNLPGPFGFTGAYQPPDWRIAQAAQACQPNCPPFGAGSCGPSGPNQMPTATVGGAVVPASGIIVPLGNGSCCRLRRSILGLQAVTVAGGVGQSATSSTTPKRPFRGLRITLPSDITATGLARSLKVSTYEQFVTAQTANSDIPLRLFDQTSRDTGFVDMDWASQTDSIDLTLINNALAALPFIGGIEGLMIEGT